MKNYLFYLITLFGLFSLTGCNDDDPMVILSQTEFKDISYEGGTFKIELQAGGEWTATSMVDWCKVSKSISEGPGALVVEVKGNLGKARSGEVIVYSQGEKQAIRFSQQALPEQQELKYRLPLVFHVLYNDVNDPDQNIAAESLYKILDEVNRIYREAGGDLNLEFVLAETDPAGNLLEEPGIDRIKWVSPVLDAQDFMSNNKRKYNHLLWEPNDYVNVMVYQFTIPNLLGISTFPYSPASHPMDGTETIQDMNITLKNLSYAYCVSLNSSYIHHNEDIFEELVPDEYRDLMHLQTKAYITLAHELGHYLGLRHAFSEMMDGSCGDTDFCDDTPSYNRDEYDSYVQSVYQQMSMSQEFIKEFKWESLFKRVPCQGKKFESHNIMDYSYSKLDEFTADQRARVRHVLNYSPLIPGPKYTRAALTRNPAPEGVLDLPITVMDIEPRPLLNK